MKRLCLAIPKKEASIVHSILKETDLFDVKFQTKTDEEQVFFPIKRPPTSEERALLKSQVSDRFEVVKIEVNPQWDRPRNLKEALKESVPNGLIEDIPKALDIIGTIAIIDLQTHMEEFAEPIAKGIMLVNPQLTTVFQKKSGVSGIHRTRDLKLLAGEAKFQTIQKENGCIFYVDVSTVYFSPRLGTEHKRVADLIDVGSNVLDMFCGVGPFSILIAKSRGSKVTAVDINSKAIELLQRNIRANKVNQQITPLNSDIRNVNSRILRGKFNHVIMNLPSTAYTYLDVALSALKDNTGTIHFYCFTSSPDPEKKAIRLLTDELHKHGDIEIRIEDVRKVKPSAPHEWHMAVTARIQSEKP